MKDKLHGKFWPLAHTIYTLVLVKIFLYQTVFYKRNNGANFVTDCCWQVSA